MENGQPNRVLKWKRTGKTLGIMFGITFMIYFAALSYLAEAKLIISVMVFGKFNTFLFVQLGCKVKKENIFNQLSKQKLFSFIQMNYFRFFCSFKYSGDHNMALWTRKSR